MRVHHLWLQHREAVYLVFIYGKGEVDTLTDEQKRPLRMIVEGIKKERGSRHSG